MEAPADIKWTGYSLAERDWRWRRVREGAAKAGFDCILVPLCVDGRNLHLSLRAGARHALGLPLSHLPRQRRSDFAQRRPRADHCF